MFRFGAGRRPPAVQRPTTGLADTRDAGDALDLALIGRIVARDLAAFETLYRIYDARLARFLGLMIARRTLLEEVLNDTMLVVWNRAATYNQQSKVSTWIFAIAYRTALKALHRQDEPVADPADEPMTGQPGPEERHADGETRAALMHALDMLSSEQRSVLVLTYFHDLPYAEIAQIMSCPIDTVKTRVFHARRRLRALLSGELGDWL
jgi:RNA polymerase sigma factor (sigma-70 family)